MSQQHAATRGFPRGRAPPALVQALAPPLLAALVALAHLDHRQHAKVLAREVAQHVGVELHGCRVTEIAPQRPRLPQGVRKAAVALQGERMRAAPSALQGPQICSPSSSQLTIQNSHFNSHQNYLGKRKPRGPAAERPRLKQARGSSGGSDGYTAFENHHRGFQRCAVVGEAIL